MNKFIKFINNLYKKHFDFIRVIGTSKINITIYLLLNLILKVFWLKLYYLIKSIFFIYYLWNKKRYLRLILVILFILFIQFIIYLKLFLIKLFFIIFFFKIYVYDYIYIKKKRYLKNPFNNFLINYQSFIDNKIFTIYKYIIQRIK